MALLSQTLIGTNGAKKPAELGFTVLITANAILIKDGKLTTWTEILRMTISQIFDHSYGVITQVGLASSHLQATGTFENLVNR